MSTTYKTPQHVINSTTEAISLLEAAYKKADQSDDREIKRILRDALGSLDGLLESRAANA
jgi:hypothetical protein